MGQEQPHVSVQQEVQTGLLAPHATQSTPPQLILRVLSAVKSPRRTLAKVKSVSPVLLKREQDALRAELARTKQEFNDAQEAHRLVHADATQAAARLRSTLLRKVEESDGDLRTALIDLQQDLQRLAHLVAGDSRDPTPRGVRDAPYPERLADGNDASLNPQASRSSSAS